MKFLACVLFALCVFFTALLPSAFAQDDNFSSIPGKYIAEAEQFNLTCQNTPKYARYYNCECMAMSYLDQRLKAGDRADQSAIIFNMDKSACHDATKAKSYYNQQCMQRPNIFESDIPREIYCGCFSDRVADLYNSGNFGSGSKDSVRVQTLAYRYCGDRDRLFTLLEGQLNAVR